MTLKQQILDDIRVEISDEFDRNFERKAFFDKRWKARKQDGRGTLLMRTGKLRRSISARVRGNSVVFTSSEPYAAIHNEGGTITVTKKMKRYFWAMYYEKAGKIKYKKSGGMTKASVRISEEAEIWKALANGELVGCPVSELLLLAVVVLQALVGFKEGFERQQ